MPYVWSRRSQRLSVNIKLNLLSPTPRTPYCVHLHRYVFIDVEYATLCSRGEALKAGITAFQGCYQIRYTVGLDFFLLKTISRHTTYPDPSRARLLGAHLWSESMLNRTLEQLHLRYRSSRVLPSPEMYSIICIYHLASETRFIYSMCRSRRNRGPTND